MKEIHKNRLFFIPEQKGTPDEQKKKTITPTIGIGQFDSGA